MCDRVGPRYTSNLGKSRAWAGPVVLSVDAGGACDISFSSLSNLFMPFSLCLGDGSIFTEISSQIAVKSKTTSLSNMHLLFIYS